VSKYRIGRWASAPTALLSLVVLLLLVGAPVAPAAQPARTADGTRGVQVAPLNPEFVLWQARRSVNDALRSVDGLGLGQVPAPQIPYDDEPPETRLPLAGYASRYDLRDEDKLTPVKDQGEYGTCWAFATFGSLESCLLPGESADFSEDNLVLQNGFDTGSTAHDKYMRGGHIWYSTAYLARWGGPVWESEDAYGDDITPGGLSARAHVQDISFYAPRASSLDNDRIKYAVTTDGGAYVSMSWQGSSLGSIYYKAATHAYYYNEPTYPNHAVVVVGWDDDYAKSNFALAPPGNGAFIVRNSWGTDFGDGGYFYVSYYDTVFGRYDYAATVEGAESMTNYDAIYQYDPLGEVGAIGMDVEGWTTFWGANRFTAGAGSRLGAVGFYAEAPNTAYEVWEGPALDRLTKIAAGTLPQMGFHTVTPADGPALTKGVDFVVAVKLTTPGNTYPLAIEYPAAGYSSAASASPGQSFVSWNGTTWDDVTLWKPGANVCLKAYATSVIDTTTPVTTDDHLTAPLVAPATITLTPTDTYSGMIGGEARTEYKVDGADAYTTGTRVVLERGEHTVAYRSTDAAGNLETPDKSFTVTVTPAPLRSAGDYAFAPDTRSGWHKTPQTVTITASGGAGTDRAIHVSTDGGATWTATAGDSARVPVDGQGSHRVQYYAADSLATEAVHDAGYVNIDSRRPVTRAAPAAVRKGRRVTLRFSVADAQPGCGKAVVKLQIRRRGRVAQTIRVGVRATNTALTYRLTARLARGTYTCRVLATDIAGNTASRIGSARLVMR